MQKIVIAMFALFVLVGCQTTGTKVEYTTASGYSTNSLVYLPDAKNSNDIVFVIMHGKSSRPDAAFRLALYPQLTDNGYEVIAPKMPWSFEWAGTPDDGVLLIDEIVSQVAKHNKKVVLVGHSLGGANALIYASKKPKEEVIGVVVIAPGHMLHKSKRMQRVTKDSVEKARRMVDSGMSDKKDYFAELNTGKVKQVYMSAKTYLSYYDAEQFPDVEELLPDLNLPVLWIAGDSDRLTSKYEMELMFEGLPDNPKNKYIELTGGHKTVLSNSATSMVNWVRSL